jgi:starvation-inducible DNA-binding protein
MSPVKPNPKKKRQLQAVQDSLARLLASSYTLYLKTHNYHWNVTGPMFTTLHTLFELEYTELALAVDEIAERMRTLGAYAPGSYVEFAKLTTVKEAAPRTPALEMIRNLVADQEEIVRLANALIATAEKAGDQASMDLGVRRAQVHQKNAWMLRSHLES